MLDTLDALLVICSIADKDKERFGKVKLNKAMFFSDLEYYLRTGDRLTNTVYKKDTYGPVVNNLDVFLQKMQKEKKIHIRLVDNVNYDGSRTEISCLAKSPIDVSDSKYKRFKLETQNLIENYSANSASELSHNEIYNFFDFGQVIDFEIARAIKMKCTNQETKRWAETFSMDFAH